MKKTIVLVLIMMLCLLCGCSKQNAVPSPDSMEGSYALVDAAGEGSYEIMQIKDGIHLEVRADNTATLSLMTDVHELYFDEAKGVCTSGEDDQEVPFTFDGKTLVMDSDPFRMVFERKGLTE